MISAAGDIVVLLVLEIPQLAQRLEITAKLVPSHHQFQLFACSTAVFGCISLQLAATSFCLLITVGISSLSVPKVNGEVRLIDVTQFRNEEEDEGRETWPSA